jgi:hypothetical protein
MYSWITPRPDDGTIKHLRNVSQLVPEYTSQEPIFKPDVVTQTEGLFTI